MEPELVVSIVVRIIAAGWAAWLARREREWRIAIFAVLSSLMAVQQTFRVFGVHSELPGLFATGVAIVAMVLMGRVLEERTRMTDALMEKDRRNGELVASLTATNAELEQVYRTAPVGLALVDRDLRFVRINDRLAAINGRAVAEHVGRTLGEALPELAPRLSDLYRAVLDTGRPILDIEVHGTTLAEPGVERDWLASYHPFLASDGAVQGVGAVVIEVTERKQAENTLRESEHRYRQLFDASPDALFIVSPTGQFLDANQTAATRYGYSRDEFLQLSAQELAAPNLREQSPARIRDALPRSRFP